MRPTEEQQAVIDACVTGLTGASARANLIVEAGAGSGKTTTCASAACAMLDVAPRTRGLYVAYNKVTALEARDRFPQAVDCRTGHSLAYARYGKPMRHKLPNARPAQAHWEIAKTFDIRDLVLDVAGSPTPAVVPAIKVVASAKDAVDRFCRSADPELALGHVGRDALPVNVDRAHYGRAVLCAARVLWADLRDPQGWLRTPHDVYRKLWALSEPKLGVDFFMLDEAQDTAPVLAAVLRAQDCQQIAVGDSSQQLYQWAGAVNAMANWGAADRLYLRQSWRFGEAIAIEANKWLSLLPTELRLRGNPAIDSELAALGATARAVLCRTNVGAVGEVMLALQARKRVALVGGGREIESLARAAADLQRGRRTKHPELCVFTSWEEVRKAAGEENADTGLKVLVHMIETYGTDAVLDTMRSLEPREDRADMIVSTGHKAKGREWVSVRVSDDFAPRDQDKGPDGNPLVRPDDAMLSYVAVTRAKRALDRGPLSYVDECVGEPALSGGVQG